MSKSASSATSDAIPIVVNGEQREIRAGTTVEAFLGERRLDSDLVVVERNGAILPRHSFAATTLEPKDELEIVHFVGGG